MLGMARWLSGTGSWDMLGTSEWRPGFPTLIAPVFWFTDDSQAVIRSVLVINAALGGTAAVVLALLARRLTDLSAAACLAAAGAVSLLPPALTASAHLWSEPLVTLCFLVTMHLTLRFSDRPSPWLGTACIGFAVLGSTVHGRLLPLIVVTGAITIWGVYRASGIRPALSLVGISATLTLLSELYTQWVSSHLWVTSSDTNSVGEVVRRLADPAAVMRAIAGQTWYLFASTALLFGFGLLELLSRAAQPGGGASKRDSRVVLSLTVPLMALSFVFVSDRARPDQLIYGRYNDAVVWPVLVVGIGWLVTSSALPARAKAVRTGVVVALFGIVSIASAYWHGDALSSGWGLRAMVAGVLPLSPSGGVDVLQASLLCLLLSSVLGLCLLFGQARILTVAGLCIVGFAGLRTLVALGDGLNTGQDIVANADRIEAAAPTHQPIGVLFIDNPALSSVPPAQQLAIAYYYQWALADRSFYEADSTVSGLVLIPADVGFADRQFETVWEDPGLPVKLAVLDG
ncbi:hypothetical protein BDK89_4127 [Ilumatobacter fluminis]|uniref:Dolichyl-phosphate-mannose-protein mannosyltransferase n=2 Tax=Ilumatobacter fluminis TaxID=467091 RepID=A0A4R7I6M0_9ACTN|nr:hypothetical protein BDK89_4127 [Ilumatobacter fluminis]